MQRVKTKTAVSDLPAYSETGTPGYFRNGDPVAGTQATVPGQDWFNMVQEELLNVITAAELAPSATDDTQLLQAIMRLIAAGRVTVENASETVAGILKLGTQAQVDMGTDDTAAVTSKKLAVRLAALLSAIPAPAVVTGASRNLVISSTGTSAAVTLTADELVLKDSSGKSMLLSNVTLAADLVAANVDTGAAVKASSWYAEWVFAKADGTAILRFSESTTVPTPPDGYTYKARVGMIPTDATASKFPLSLRQHGRRAQYAVSPGTNVTALPTMSAGAQGNVSTPVTVSVATGSFVPPTARAITIVLAVLNAFAIAAVAPNNFYGAYNSATNPPPVAYVNASGNLIVAPSDLLLESATIYWSSNTANNRLCCLGWEDSL